jgi:hypothetical protein
VTYSRRKFGSDKNGNSNYSREAIEFLLLIKKIKKKQDIGHSIGGVSLDKE